MSNTNRFNLRTYGILINTHQEILVSEELIGGNTIIKFPGGGVEYGEGIIDALRREWLEELNTKIIKCEHFYTTDFFQKSAWDNSQIISVYYLIKEYEDLPVLPYFNGNERFYFLEIEHHLKEIITLPIDKIVIGKLANILSSH